MTAVLVALDSFKGSIRAVDACQALAEGWRSGRADGRVDICPVADGGEGTLDAFESNIPRARRVPIEVTGPDGRAVKSTWLLIPTTGEGSAGRTAVVELASTSGFELLDHLRPYTANTVGFGQAVAAALDFGVERVLLALGSSSSTDCGIGFLEGIGAGLFEGDVATSARGAAGLAALSRIDMSTARRIPAHGAVALVDVTAPLLGPRGAARLFGPQKGLSEEEAIMVDGYLHRVSTLAPDVDPNTPGAGAAGGTGFAVLMWGGHLSPGIATLADLVGLTARIQAADLVVTGEGFYDLQSAAGKAPWYIANLCAAVDRPVCLVAGGADPRADTSSFCTTISLTSLAGTTQRAIADPQRFLFEAGTVLAAWWSRLG